MTTLFGRRVLLRPLVVSDFESWQAVRRANAEWLIKWEPQRLANHPDPVEDRHAFSVRCSARQRERQLGTAYGFGIFVSGNFAGEMNISSIQRGPFQSAYVGYWIDRRLAGEGYTPEAFVVATKFVFEDIGLHRIQASVIPRNTASRRVMDKLGLREEGTAQRYLEINGVWEDHVRYAMTAEEWQACHEDLEATWLD
ncbi:MAG: GNAT family protein [Acidimicrobiales bacterium]